MTGRHHIWMLIVAVLGLSALGCSGPRAGCGPSGGRLGGLFARGQQGPAYDRPFPLGQVSDSHWETQQTNAEAADFIFYDHEFVGDTRELTPGGKKKLQQVALRLEHVPFPVVIEEMPIYRPNHELEIQRRRQVVEQLARLGVEDVERRVVVSTALAPGITAVEGERAYYSTIFGNSANPNGGGRRFGGFGGMFR